MEQQYDVVVIGGGPAGLSGALALSRARRSVLVVDAGAPRNAPAGHVHNYLAREGTPPADLLAAGRAEVARYGGRFASGEVTAARAEDDGLAVDLAEGGSVRARRLLVTTGLVDELPDVPGVRELWGTDVLHCPYCHGWEARDSAVGVLSTSPFGVHQALMWRQWTPDVTLFLHTGPEPAEEQWEELAARGISVVGGEVACLETAAGRLSGVRLASGRLIAQDAVVVSPRFTARSAVLASLGLAAEPQEMLGHVFGTAVPSGPFGATAVPGLWVAGNVTDPRAQVISSAAAGLEAGAAINGDLITEDTRRAVAARRVSSPAGGRELRDQVPGDRRHGSGGGTVHEHEHEHGDQPANTGHDLASWEERYATAAALWSGRVNPTLAAQAADLPPARALDVGCGEGADALWLAEHGWQVTGLDWSEVALARAAEHARAAGLAERVEWVRGDVADWQPPAAAYDLVTAHFLHPQAALRHELVPRLAAAVAPGGTLLWVGHGMDAARAAAWGADRFASAAEVFADLDPADWEVVTVGAQPRPAGEHGHDADELVRVRRR